jgi:NADH:ubiquinone oxidoreductase subunit E
MSSDTHSGCIDTQEHLIERICQLTHNYKGRENGLIQVLHLVQGVFGYLPLEVQEIVAKEMDIPLSTVSGVVSFYSFFATEPRGKHTIRICLGTACYVRGGVSIMDAIEKQLGIKVGHTTPDGVFTFEIARCIGACGLAPAMIIDSTVYPEVDPGALPELLASWYKDDGEGV